MKCVIKVSRQRKKQSDGNIFSEGRIIRER